MDNLLILGAGQYGAVVHEIAQATGCFGQIDFLDDRSEAAIGSLEDCGRFYGRYRCAVVAMGSPELRSFWTKRLQAVGFSVPTLIHPRAWVSPSAQLGAGTVVEPMAVVQSFARVGSGCLLCAGCVVNHNAQVEDFCQIDCNTVIPANARVESGTKVPCGSVFAAQV